MEIVYKSQNGRFTVKFMPKDEKEFFSQLAAFQQIFEVEKCGDCLSTNLKFKVRDIDGNVFYELVCRDCGSRFNFGQTKKGNQLFPRTHDLKTNKMIGNWGWAKPPKGKQEIPEDTEEDFGDAAEAPKAVAPAKTAPRK